MRLGGPVFKSFANPDEWAAAIKKCGYSAAVFPIGPDAGDETAREYEEAARKAGIVIAEVGVWNNPLDSDHEKRRHAITACQRSLELAERVGALCCVNIAGSRGEQWDGPHEENLTDETFSMIVDTTREIIDAVKPRRTFYTLETMPWIFPDSPESYVKLIRAIDRKAFAVHLDPVNLVCSPQRYFNNAQLLKDCFKYLGPYIKSCHAKDIRLSGKLTVHLDEVCPGHGMLDYRVYLSELDKLGKDVPLIIEHLNTEEEALAARKYIMSTATELGITIV